MELTLFASLVKVGVVSPSMIFLQPLKTHPNLSLWKIF